MERQYSAKDLDVGPAEVLSLGWEEVVPGSKL